MPSIYVKYVKVLEQLGLEQLDVYRFKDHDEIRVRDKKTNKVYLVKLPKKREEMELDEFKEFVLKSLKK